MGNLYNTILDLCTQKGISGGKMCVDIGISKGLLTDLKMGRRSGVSAMTAQKIASYFGVSVAYLLGQEEKKENPGQPELTEAEAMMLEVFRLIPEEQQKVFLEMGRAYANSLKKD